MSTEFKRLSESFRDMVNSYVDYAYERRVASFGKLKKGVYED